MNLSTKIYPPVSSAVNIYSECYHNLERSSYISDPGVTSLVDSYDERIFTMFFSEEYYTKHKTSTHIYFLTH